MAPPAPPECPAPTGGGDLQQSLLVILICTNVTLLFLIGLMSRRLERVSANVSRLCKATFGQPPTRRDSKTFTSPLSTANTPPMMPIAPSPKGRSSLSADDFASLQYMLGEEGGCS